MSGGFIADEDRKEEMMMKWYGKLSKTFMLGAFEKKMRFESFRNMLHMNEVVKDWNSSNLVKPKISVSLGFFDEFSL